VSEEAFAGPIPDDDEKPRRSGPFGLVPTRAALDPNLSKGALRLLVLLCSYAGKLRFTWVSQRTLAARLMPGNKMGRRNVQRLLAELRDGDYIKISTKRGKTNGYYIIHDPEVDAYIAPTVDANTAATSAQEVDAKVSIEWTPKSIRVDAPVAARTEIEQREQSESRAPLATALRSSSTPATGDRHSDPVPMSSVFPPGISNAAEWMEHVRNEKAAAKKEQATTTLVEEMFDAEALEEEEVS
jgi:hypothetical protein